MTEGETRERHNKRETTCIPRENGHSRSSVFFGVETEVLTGQARETLPYIGFACTTEVFLRFFLTRSLCSA